MWELQDGHGRSWVALERNGWGGELAVARLHPSSWESSSHPLHVSSQERQQEGGKYDSSFEGEWGGVKVWGAWGHCQATLSLLIPSEALPPAPDPTSLQGWQPLPQQGPSRARLQLPTAQPCPAIDTAEPGQPMGLYPSLSPTQPVPRETSRLVPSAPSCPAPGWGSAIGPGCQTLPCTPGGPHSSQPTQHPERRADRVSFLRK